MINDSISFWLYPHREINNKFMTKYLVLDAHVIGSTGWQGLQIIRPFKNTRVDYDRYVYTAYYNSKTKGGRLFRKKVSRMCATYCLGISYTRCTSKVDMVNYNDYKS